MKIFAANWKLHKNPTEARSFFAEFRKQVQSKSSEKVIFFPTSVCLEATSEALKGSSFHWGAQNVSTELKGAFTGETSAQAVKDLGGNYVLVGHSERRTLFLEKDDILAQKFQLVQGLGLIPMLCIGETLSQRESGQTVQILEEQLRNGLSKAESSKPFVVAYEPVWAIGTGKVATVEQVQQAHSAVFSILRELEFSAATPILYGGSVKAENAKELVRIPHVDGFLVGGASLEVASFKAICESAR